VNKYDDIDDDELADNCSKLATCLAVEDYAYSSDLVVYVT